MFTTPTRSESSAHPAEKEVLDQRAAQTEVVMASKRKKAQKSPIYSLSKVQPRALSFPTIADNFKSPFRPCALETQEEFSKRAEQAQVERQERRAEARQAYRQASLVAGEQRRDAARLRPKFLNFSGFSTEAPVNAAPLMTPARPSLLEENEALARRAEQAHLALQQRRAELRRSAELRRARLASPMDIQPRALQLSEIAMDTEMPSIVPAPVRHGHLLFQFVDLKPFKKQPPVKNLGRKRISGLQDKEINALIFGNLEARRSPIEEWIRMSSDSSVSSTPSASP